MTSGVYGELRLLRSSFGFPPLKSGDIRYQKSLGGGALLDAGAYPIKISQILLGTDLKVLSSTINSVSTSKVDIYGSMMLQSKSTNTPAQLSFGFDNFYQCNLELWFSKAKITATRIFTAPPGFKPKIIIEQQDRIEELQLPSDNHFKKMLGYFHHLIIAKNIENEYYGNIKQAELLEEVKRTALGVVIK